MPNVVYATSTTSVTNKHGVVYRLEAGQAWDEDDPLVESHPNLFTKEPIRMRTSKGWVETATARPGEKRKSGRGK